MSTNVYVKMPSTKYTALFKKQFFKNNMSA